MERLQAALRALAPHAILVGSAAVSDERNDIDLTVSEKGLAIAKEVLAPWTSAFIGSVTGHPGGVQVEVWTDWYGPPFSSLVRRRSQLTRRSVFGIEFRAWPFDPREVS